MDENLQGVTSMVGNLRNMAMDMNSEIGTQNETLGRINAKVSHSNTYSNPLSCLILNLFPVTRLDQTKAESRRPTRERPNSINRLLLFSLTTFSHNLWQGGHVNPNMMNYYQHHIFSTATTLSIPLSQHPLSDQTVRLVSGQEEEEDTAL